MTFRVTMHPALDGDCIVVSWGSSSTLHHIIVDLGRFGTYRAVKSHLGSLENVELFVMSHVDADHIGGAIPLVREPTPPFAPKRVWYNARPHLIAARDRQTRIEPFGARQGEKLARGIVNFRWPWNAEFQSEVVSVDSPEAAEPIAIADGLTIRLLSPGDSQLIDLLPVWEAELRKARISPFDPDEGDDPLSPRFEPFGVPNVDRLAAEAYAADRTEPNGASIAFVAEFAGKRVLLAADAHSEVMETALTKLARAEGGRYRVDLLKVSHHASKEANTTKTLPTLIDCTRFAVSTNGDRHDHPNPQTIARLFAADKDRPKTVYFNYRQAQTDVWDSPRLKGVWKYDCVFPVAREDDVGNGTLSIDV
jgi:beta-lactamase superfamily II metal-dependent hydrolase